MRVIADTLTRIVEENWFFLLLLAGIAAAWLLLRQQGTPLSSLQAFEDQVQSGQPVVVELFSNA